MAAAAGRYADETPTRERILDEVERLIASKGVHGFILRDVAEPLGVQAPAIYKHYESRDDVLVAVSRRFLGALAAQFAARPFLTPSASLRAGVAEFIDFNLDNPAYVRIALDDFATPGAGAPYVKLAGGGPFRKNFASGRLSPLSRRLRSLIRAGVLRREFRDVTPLALFRVVYATTLMQLVFPDDAPLQAPPTAPQRAKIRNAVWDIVSSYLALPRASPRKA